MPFPKRRKGERTTAKAARLLLTLTNALAAEIGLSGAAERRESALITVPLRFLAATLFATAILAGLFAVAADARAQEATLIYKAEPANLVSLRADGYLIYKGQQAGTMTATVFGITGTIANQVFTPRNVNATGMVLITLRGLESCAINNPGCAAFGLEDLSTPAVRLASLIAMNPVTVTMFAASGANLNEQVGGNLAQNFLLYHLATANRPLRFSILLTSGASVDAKDSSGATPLFYAAASANIAAMTLFLAAGAELTLTANNGQNPLHFAVAQDAVTAVTVLLGAGADVGATATNGDTPLHIAASVNHTAAMDALLASGAVENTVNDDGNTPLHLASRGGHSEAAFILLGNGASVNATNLAGDRPMHGAALGNHPAVVTVLLAGANISINAQNLQNETPLDSAIRAAKLEAATALVNNGGECVTQITNALCPNQPGAPVLTLNTATPNRTFVIRSGSLSEDGVIGKVIVGAAGGSGGEENDDEGGILLFGMLPETRFTVLARDNAVAILQPHNR